MSMFETIYLNAADDPLRTDGDHLAEGTDSLEERVKIENHFLSNHVEEPEAANKGVEKVWVSTAPVEEFRVKTELVDTEGWNSEVISYSLDPSVIIKKEENIEDNEEISGSCSPENHEETEPNDNLLMTALSQGDADGFYAKEYSPGRMVFSSHLEAWMKNKSDDSQNRTGCPSSEMPENQSADEELACSSGAVKRRKSDPSMWIRNVKKRDRNFGKDKTFSDVDCGCKTLWHAKLGEAERESNFNLFWGMGDHSRQNVFICERVIKKEVKRPRSRRGVRPRKSWSLEFHVLNMYAQSVRVCKQYFLDTFQISAGRLMRALQKERLGRAGEDLRGKTKLMKTDNPMADVVRSHILSFPLYSSHRTRSRSPDRRYLPSHLNIRKMFSLYTEHYENTEEKLIPEAFYRKVFNDLNLSFCVQRDVCRTCERLKVLIEAANDTDDVNALKSEAESHRAAMASDSDNSHSLKEDGESRHAATASDSNDSYALKADGKTANLSLEEEAQLVVTKPCCDSQCKSYVPNTRRTRARMKDAQLAVHSCSLRAEHESHCAKNGTEEACVGENAPLSDDSGPLRTESVSHSAEVEVTKARKGSRASTAECESHLAKTEKAEAYIEDRKPAASSDALRAELDRHLEEVNKAKECMKEDTQLALTNLHYHVVSFALQKALPFPSVTASAAYYKRRMYCNNFGVHDLANNHVWMYLWDETTAARGPQEVATCLATHLKAVVKKPHVICYCDDAGRNRNLDMALTLMKVAQDASNPIWIIDLKFLMRGHFCTKNDTDFASVESVAKHKVIYDFPDWVDTIKTSRMKSKPNVHVMPQEDFVSTDQLKESVTMDGEVDWCKVQWIRFCQYSPNIMFYKEVFDDSPFNEVRILPAEQGLEPFTSIKQQRLFDGQRPVAEVKKSDMLDLLAYIPPFKHGFFLNLETNEDLEDEVPLSEFEDDDDEN